MLWSYKIFNNYPCVRTMDYNDCGPACLATILKLYGCETNVTRISELAKTDINGTTILGIIKAANCFGIKGKGLYSNVENFETQKELFTKFVSVKAPFIAHLVLEEGVQHYVVVYKTKKDLIIVADPSTGLKKYDIDTFLKLWTGNIIVFQKEENLKTDEHERNINFLKSTIKTQSKLFLGIILLSLIVSGLGITTTLFFQTFIDELIPNNSVNELLKLSMIVVGIIVIKNVAEFFRNFMIMALSKNIDFNMMIGFYKHIVKLPISFFDSKKIGSIISRFTDAVKIRLAVSNAAVTVVLDCFMSIIAGIVLYNINESMFFYCFIPLLIYLVLAIVFFDKIDKLNSTVMEANAEVVSHLVETVEGISEIKSFHSEKIFVKKNHNKFKKYTDLNFKTDMMINIQMLIRKMTKDIFQIFTLVLGGYLAIEGELTIGEAISFYILLSYFIEPIERILSLQSQIQTARVADERLEQVMNLKPEVLEQTQLEKGGLTGDICFENIDFRYGYRNKVLTNFSLHITGGEHVSLVGESGAGKSTIIKLLMKFYEIEKGVIRIGNVNICDVSTSLLREKIAYVAQESYFFTGSIRDNLKMWNKEITDEEMIELCKKFMIHDYIITLAKGYDEILTEKANNISGGQRQRLAIVRALLKKPQILILDEATSHLDTITEQKIEINMQESLKNMTVIRIAHRLSTAKNSDTIFVLQKGQIVEHGNHEQLVSKQGIYNELWKRQEY